MHRLKRLMPSKRRNSSVSSVDSGAGLPNFVVEELRRSLLSWYAQSGRDLPWRKTRDPYAIWISEIMLQQTQVKTVMPYFERWMEKFPTIAALASSDLHNVLKASEVFGFFALGSILHLEEQAIATEFDGVFPQELESVLKLPGIGKTTAGGILSAAFNQPLAILDGNVKRVLARVMALDVPPNKAMNRLLNWSETLVDPENGRDFNQALMDLGATVCTPRNPACLICPWRSHCRAYNLGVQSELPMSESRAPLPHKIIGVAVIWNRDRTQILIDRRKPEGLLGGLWEFPGGKVEADETIEACIAREIQEELGIEIEVGDRLIVVDHVYTHFRVTLNVHHCAYVSGEPQPIECDEVKWVAVNELEQYPFPKANLQIIEALKSDR